MESNDGIMSVNLKQNTSLHYIFCIKSAFKFNNVQTIHVDFKIEIIEILEAFFTLIVHNGIVS